MTATTVGRDRWTRTLSSSTRARNRSELTVTDRIIRAVLLIAAIIPTAVLAFLAYQMVAEAIPAIRFSGGHFFATKTFNLGNQYGNVQVKHGEHAMGGAQFGILSILFGTLVSSVFALLLAVPVSVGGAILLVEKLPDRLQGPLGVFLELLAGIPSVIFGLWGVYTIGPLLHRTVFQWISDLGVPWFTGNSTTNPQGLATAAVILAVMIVPIIASITRELVRGVPAVSKEGAVALGLTPTETVRFVTIPFIKTGIAAAAILGWARALGETIAVLLISGNQLTVPKNVFDPFTTMAAGIAQLLDTALQDPTQMAVHALGYVGLILLAVTLLTNFGGRLLTRRFSDAGLPVGRGV